MRYDERSKTGALVEMNLMPGNERIRFMLTAQDFRDIRGAMRELSRQRGHPVGWSEFVRYALISKSRQMGGELR